MLLKKEQQGNFRGNRDWRSISPNWISTIFARVYGGEAKLTKGYTLSSLSSQNHGIFLKKCNATRMVPQWSKVVQLYTLDPANAWAVQLSRLNKWPILNGSSRLYLARPLAHTLLFIHKKSNLRSSKTTVRKLFYLPEHEDEILRWLWSVYLLQYGLQLRNHTYMCCALQTRASVLTL